LNYDGGMLVSSLALSVPGLLSCCSCLVVVSLALSPWTSMVITGLSPILGLPLYLTCGLSPWLGFGRATMLTPWALSCSGVVGLAPAWHLPCPVAYGTVFPASYSVCST